MLTAIQLQQQRRRRPVPSLKQQYQEYVLERIEGYKNSLSRCQLLDLANEAVAEMEEAQSGQFLLTEVLVTDWVDRLIHRRLGLLPYGRWAKGLRQLRAAQREPTHWGIDPKSPITRLLPRLETGDSALVMGTDAAPHACLLAAHDIEVTYTGDEMSFVDQVESRIAGEALGHYCQTYVAPTGHLPLGVPCRFNLVILDTGTLDSETPAGRREILGRLQDMTLPGGVHMILPSDHALSPDACLCHYPSWQREEPPADKRRPARSLGLLLVRPTDSPVNSGEGRPREVSA